MATLEYIFCCICLIGMCVLVVGAVLAGVAVLVTIAINFIKESKEDGKR